MEKKDEKQAVEKSELDNRAREAFGLDCVSCLYSTSSLHVYSGESEVKGKLKFLKKKRTDIKVLDNFGVVKLQLLDAEAKEFISQQWQSALAYVESRAAYSDAGMMIPRVFMIYGERICDYSSILDFKQLESLIKLETEGLEPTERIILALERRKV